MTPQTVHDLFAMRDNWDALAQSMATLGLTDDAVSAAIGAAKQKVTVAIHDAIKPAAGDPPRIVVYGGKNYVAVDGANGPDVVEDEPVDSSAISLEPTPPPTPPPSA